MKKFDKFLPKHLKSGQIKEINALFYINYVHFNVIKCLGQKFVKFFRW